MAGFEHSYGLYVFRCIGGRMTQSVGYGNGDSAFYVGGTPFQAHPQTTTLDHDTGYENVLGYSGTNSKYIVIRDSEFYNNGAGVVPNTLKLRAVPARHVGADRAQPHLLEQLRLLPQGVARQDGLRRPVRGGP